MDARSSLLDLIALKQAVENELGIAVDLDEQVNVAEWTSFRASVRS